MRNFQEKKGLKRFLQSKPVLMLLFVLVIVFTWNVISLVGKLQETIKNKKIQEEEIYNLQKRREKLSNDIEKINTEKGKEEIIRENFGLVKEGEEVIVIIEDKNNISNLSENKNKGFWFFLKGLFN